MGKGLILTCKKCGFEETFKLGIGMRFPDDYENIIANIRNGKYGQEWQNFFEKNSGAVVDASRVIYYCEECHKFLNDYDMSLYNRKNGIAPEDGYWLVASNPDSEYEYIKSYEHKCTKCKKEMKRIEEKEISSLLCPQCGNSLNVEELKWD